MAGSTKEQPVLEEAPQTEETEVSAQEQAEALLSQLENLNVSSPEELQNMANASSQTGNMARLLGEAKDQIKELTNQVQQLQHKPQEQYQDMYNQYENQNAITPASIRDELRRFYTEEVIKPQQEAQGRILGEMSQIQKDADYAMFASQWEEHFNSPQVQQRVYGGQVTPMAEYQNFKLGQFRNLLTQTTSTLKDLTKKGAKPIPHVETSGDSHVPTSTPADDLQEGIKKWTEKPKSGADQDIHDLVNVMFPKGDPMLDI